MSNENTNQTETEIIQPAESSAPTEKQDVVVEVIGFKLELFKGL